MLPPRNYDALRQAEQQAREARDAPAQPEASAQLDSAQEEPTRPTRHPATFAQYGDDGAPNMHRANFDAAEIAREAKAHEDAIAQSRQQEKGKGGNER